MIDYFALALTHALIVIALLRIAGRPELDREEWDPSAEDGPEPASDTRPRRLRRKRTDA